MFETSRSLLIWIKLRKRHDWKQWTEVDEKKSILISKEEDWERLRRSRRSLFEVSEPSRCYTPSSTPCGARDYSKPWNRVILFSLTFGISFFIYYLVSLCPPWMPGFWALPFTTNWRKQCKVYTDKEILFWFFLVLARTLINRVVVERSDPSFHLSVIWKLLIQSRKIFRHIIILLA